MTPFQKAKIVEEIRTRKQAVTLAIGDGKKIKNKMFAHFIHYSTFFFLLFFLYVCVCVLMFVFGCFCVSGANDEAMILKANVGVGISGLEGTAASRYYIIRTACTHTYTAIYR